VVAARQQWTSTGRRGERAADEDLAAARAFLDDHEGPFTRKDLYDAFTPSFVASLEEWAGKAGQDPVHFAAGRMIWQLSNEGDICTVYKQGSQQAYAYRKHWLPEFVMDERLQKAAQDYANLMGERGLYGHRIRRFRRQWGTAWERVGPDGRHRLPDAAAR